jgi:hypothetical protein
MADKRINLNLGIPGIATDGNAITIRDNGDTSLVFFQISPQEDQNSDEIPANAVAHVRLSFEELKALDEAIHKTIEQHEAKKKTK